MTLPNQLTLLRLALTVVFVVCLTVEVPFGRTFAFLVFVLATITDYLDGVLARRLGQITDFGKLMDPLADKVLTASAFICLIPAVDFPAWAVIIIIAREFLITGLRLLAGAKGVLLPAERLGKHKTAWQMITILFYLLLLAAGDWPALFSEELQQLGWTLIGPALIGITVLLTVYSGAAYLWKSRRLIDFR
ncbi:MAG: CDP-diacylglycerol--glycerol-3-phosphate 3-phosphatidyltransferase [Terrimicrobiaceae bacterium]